MTRKLSPARQAAIPLQILELEPGLNTSGRVFVGVQNIALARIDIEPEGRPRKVALNLYGVRDIDRLIAALQVAKAALQEQERQLDEFYGRHPAVAAA